MWDEEGEMEERDGRERERRKGERERHGRERHWRETQHVHGRVAWKREEREYVKEGGVYEIEKGEKQKRAEAQTCTTYIATVARFVLQ